MGTCELRFRRAFSQCFLSNAWFFQRNRHTATILLKNRIVCEYYQRSRATTTRKDSFNKQNRSSGRIAHFLADFFCLHRSTNNIKFDLDGNAIVPLFFSDRRLTSVAIVATSILLKTPIASLFLFSPDINGHKLW